MRTVPILAAVVAAIVAAGAAFAGPQEDVVEQIRTDGDPAKDVLWRSDEWLYVGVLDDGTARDGLASYYCNFVAGAGLSGKSVKVIDIALLARRGDWKELGRASCDF